MSDSDSGEDYMSADFLNTTEDIRPGLVHSNILKRKYNLEKKTKATNEQKRIKPLSQIEAEQRNTGLDTALGSDNKGFAMLQKMGYTPGMKLGQPRNNESTSSGLSEPIKVIVKNNRGGLGREEEIRKKISEIEGKRAQIKVLKEKERALLTEEFQQRMRDKAMYKYLMSDLSKIRKACRKLDVDEGVEEPMRSWFWHSDDAKEELEDDDEYCEEEEEEEEEEEPLSPEDQLYFINDYLRSKYLYCVWCGIQYNDTDDFEANCPGFEKADHE